jgi:hypothetical protein
MSAGPASPRARLAAFSRRGKRVTDRPRSVLPSRKAPASGFRPIFGAWAVLLIGIAAFGSVFPRF